MAAVSIMASTKSSRRQGGSLSPVDTTGSSSRGRGVISPSPSPSPPFKLPPSHGSSSSLNSPLADRDRTGARSHSAVPPPLVMDTHPSRQLSNQHHRQLHFGSMPDFRQQQVNCYRSLSPTPLSPPVVCGRGTQEGVYSRLNRDVVSPVKRTHHHQTTPASPYLIEGYSQLNIVEDSANWTDCPHNDGYTYIDLDQIRTNSSQTRKREEERGESTDLPGHHYFVLEIPEDTERTSSPQDGVGGEYSYVDVNRRLLPQARTPSPTSHLGRQVSEYEQPVRTKKRYEPVTLGNRKRMGVAAPKPHPSRHESERCLGCTSTLPYHRHHQSEEDTDSNHVMTRSLSRKSPMSPRLSPSCISPTSPHISPTSPRISPTSSRISPTYQRTSSVSSRVSPMSPQRTSPIPASCHFFGGKKSPTPYSTTTGYMDRQTSSPPSSSNRSATPSTLNTPTFGGASHDNHVSLIITADGPILSTRRRSFTSPDLHKHTTTTTTDESIKN